jgi:succinate dehydrogenase / fumarate reductase membrane anchor subunit
MVNRHVVGAHYGLRGWLAQRVTAIVLAFYTVVAVVQLSNTSTLDFAGWRGLFTPLWMKLATMLFLTSLCVHAWVGVRNIFMDYIKSTGLRLVLHVAAIAWLVVCGSWSMLILWSIA